MGLENIRTERAYNDAGCALGGSFRKKQKNNCEGWVCVEHAESCGFLKKRMESPPRAQKRDTSYYVGVYIIKGQQERVPNLQESHLTENLKFHHNWNGTQGAHFPSRNNSQYMIHFFLFLPRTNSLLCWRG